MSDIDESLKFLIEDLQERVHKLKSFDRTDIINAYCDDLECQVILTIESVVKSLDSIQEVWIKEINRYRTALLKPTEIDLEARQLLPKFKEFDLTKNDGHLKEIAAKVEEFKAKLTATDRTISGQSEADDLKRRIKRIEKELRLQAFKGQFLRFDDNPMFELDKDLIGKLRAFDQEPLESIGKLNNLKDYNLRIGW